MSPTSSPSAKGTRILTRKKALSKPHTFWLRIAPLPSKKVIRLGDSFASRTLSNLPKLEQQQELALGKWERQSAPLP